MQNEPLKVTDDEGKATPEGLAFLQEQFDQLTTEKERLEAELASTTTLLNQWQKAQVCNECGEKTDDTYVVVNNTFISMYQTHSASQAEYRAKLIADIQELHQRIEWFTDQTKNHAHLLNKKAERIEQLRKERDDALSALSLICEGIEYSFDPTNILKSKQEATAKIIEWNEERNNLKENYLQAREEAKDAIALANDWAEKCNAETQRWFAEKQRADTTEAANQALQGEKEDALRQLFHLRGVFDESKEPEDAARAIQTLLHSMSDDDKSTFNMLIRWARMLGKSEGDSQLATARQDNARLKETSIKMPDGLNLSTHFLVRDFASALAEKLYAAELKYGYTSGWTQPDWMDECRQKLLEHIAKGDPRDVAAYCAFLWFHGEKTSLEPALTTARIEAIGGAWMPISTAPKNGSPILLLSLPDEFEAFGEVVKRPAKVAIGHWNAEGSSWVDELGGFDGDAYELAVTGIWNSGGGWFQPNEVSHWMPIPSFDPEGQQPPARADKGDE